MQVLSEILAFLINDTPTRTASERYQFVLSQGFIYLLFSKFSVEMSL